MAKKLYAISYTNEYGSMFLYDLSLGGTLGSCEFTDDMEHAKQALAYLVKYPWKTIEGAEKHFKIIEIPREGT